MTPQDGNRSNLSDPTPACSRRVVRCVTEPSLGSGCNGTVMDQWDPKRWHFTGHFHRSTYWEFGTSQQFVGFFPGPGDLFIPFQPLISGHFTIPKKRSPAAELPGPSDPFMVYFYLRFPKNNDPNVSKYTIHGSYRIVIVPSCFFPWIRRWLLSLEKMKFNGEILSLRISEVICLYEPHTLKKWRVKQVKQ